MQKRLVAALAGLLGTYLFTLDPIAPFAFSTGLAFICLVLYAVGFCARVGFGDDIETAEAKRSRHKGIKRVSSWMSDAGNRKSQARKSQAATGNLRQNERQHDCACKFRPFNITLSLKCIC